MSSRTFDEAWAAVADVDGWMTHGQAEALFAAAAKVRAGGRVVEIGSFRGRSTIVLASAAPEGVEIVAIDPHAGNDRGPQEIDGFADAAGEDHAVFVANLAASDVADRVRHVRSFSDGAHDQVADPVDVLYIDGAHRYAPARTDIRDWGARVADGGTMLIHDSFSSIGVTLAILRQLVMSTEWQYVRRSRSLAVYEKRPGRRVRNAARQLAQLPWFAKNIGLKVLLTLGAGKLLRKLGAREPAWPY